MALEAKDFYKDEPTQSWGQAVEEPPSTKGHMQLRVGKDRRNAQPKHTPALLPVGKGRAFAVAQGHDSALLGKEAAGRGNICHTDNWL